MLMILARLVRSESFWAVVKVRSPHRNKIHHNSSRGQALERRRYTCADVARVKWLLVQGRRQVVGLSVVSACSRECSTVCDSHGCSWVGHGAGGRSGAPQQPPRLTPIQFGTSIRLTVRGNDPTSTGHISGGLAPQELILGGFGESWGCT